ncbi:hypothetical protein M3231_14890 [Neobacillus mesonae]|nr:hypothetical protein [Neobacillus mesonae]
MRRWCKCKLTMDLELRTVIYAKKVEIKDVPVFFCMTCSTYEVLKPLKPDLTKLLEKVELTSDYQVFHFSEFNEVAKMITELLEHIPDISLDEIGTEVEKVKEERINVLLDLYQYARQSEDELWMSDTERRLEQLSQFRWEEHFSEAG